jgi:phosphate starvation-inducible PhoH-like protein
MKMVLTRMGEGTRMVITGDLTQIDLPAGVRCGLRDALETLEGVAGIGVVRLDKRDVVRHPLVARIVDAYEQREAAAGEQRREARRARSPEPPPHALQPGQPPGQATTHPLGKPTDSGIVLPGTRPKE